jgi:hypothetical protein
MRVSAADRPARNGKLATVDAQFPLMDSSSAVAPTVRLQGSSLFLAFYLPDCEDSAVVQFNGVGAWYYGGPNDEGLASHPLWNRGLTFYNFHRINPPDAASCWVATFHDGTLEVVAREVLVLAARTEGVSPGEALNVVLDEGHNEALDGNAA